MAERLGLALNTVRGFLTQYSGLDFTSFCVRGGVVIGARPTGICTFGEADETDAGTAISALIETNLTDFGSHAQKRIRHLYLGCELGEDAQLDVTLTGDEVTEEARTYTALNHRTDGRQHTERMPVGRDGKARYWNAAIRNLDGCDFSLDSLDALIVVLGGKPSGG
jgi:hypothetical protein